MRCGTISQDPTRRTCAPLLPLRTRHNVDAGTAGAQGDRREREIRKTPAERHGRSEATRSSNVNISNQRQTNDPSSLLIDGHPQHPGAIEVQFYVRNQGFSFCDRLPRRWDRGLGGSKCARGLEGAVGSPLQLARIKSGFSILVAINPYSLCSSTSTTPRDDRSIRSFRSLTFRVSAHPDHACIWGFSIAIVITFSDRN